MKEPTLSELRALGLDVLGRALDGNPSKKEEKLSMELALKQGEIDDLRERLQLKKRKLKKRPKPT